MLDHIGLAVTDFERSKSFFVEALAPRILRFSVEVTAEQTGGDAHAGFGIKGRPHFWTGNGQKPVGGLHVAFTAESRSQVEAFYQAGLSAGGRDNGGPGLRPNHQTLRRLHSRPRRQQHRSSLRQSRVDR